MKFTCTVTIKLPREKVVGLFKDPNNLNKWQDGFISLKHLSGREGEKGAKSKLVYNMNGREMELIETITVNRLPDEFSAKYEHRQMTNTMKNFFTDNGANRTKYVAEVEYTKFNGIMPKLMAWLMPGMFKKQTQKWLDQFKAFAENADS